MKDKAKEQEYKAEGLRRCSKRKEKRLTKLQDKISRKYSNDGYGCRKCGLSSLYCYSNGNYGYICPKCHIEFETPDT